MSYGVSLIAIGKYGYLQWAVNMAASLKYHSPSIKIQLIASAYLANEANAWAASNLFDIVTVVSDSVYMQDGKLYPALLKTSLYSFLHFDETIYLDVDGCAIANVSEIFAKIPAGVDFSSDVQGVHRIQDGNIFNAMKWAKPEIVWSHFQLPDTAFLPALNSSFMFIRKGEVCKSVFDTAHGLLIDNPLPPEMHWHPWGNKRKTKINQPDELYLNVSLAKLGVMPHHFPAVHFRMANESGPPVSIANLQQNYYAIGLFGELRSNHISLKEHYNKHMRECWMNTVYPVTGQPFYAKCELLSQSKFVIQ